MEKSYVLVPEEGDIVQPYNSKNPVGFDVPKSRTNEGIECLLTGLSFVVVRVDDQTYYPTGSANGGEVIYHKITAQMLKPGNMFDEQGKILEYFTGVPEGLSKSPRVTLTCQTGKMKRIFVPVND
jgi:hypothetical protein